MNQLQIAKLALEATKNAATSLPAVAKHFGPVAFAQANLIRQAAPYAGPIGLMLAAAAGTAIYNISTKENLQVKVKTKLRSIIVQAGDATARKVVGKKTKQKTAPRQIHQELLKLRQPGFYDEN